MLCDANRQKHPPGFCPGGYDEIYLDTCSLMEPDFRVWLRQQLPELIGAGKALLIPHAVEQELSYLAEGITSNCCGEARQARELACRLLQTGLARSCGDRKVSEQADLYLVRTASEGRFHRRIAVITQDRQLTQDLHLLNRVGAAAIIPIHTYRLEKGALVPTGTQHRRSRPTAENAAEIQKRFGL